MIYESIEKLVEYGLNCELIQPSDKVYVINRLLEALQLEEFVPSGKTFKDIDIQQTLDELLDYACQKGICQDSIVYRDLFDTKLMGLLTPAPSEAERIFKLKYKNSPKDATEYFYKLSQDTNYIRRYRIKKDIRWIAKTEYGDLDITINLSKPEKDPKAIAAAKNAKQSGYPKCLLCYENVGYAGRVDSPARQNHRVMPVVIDGQDWGFQYSPYVYYNEHCIVFNKVHTPMVIDKSAFKKLFDFVEQFPHYFLGSNADLPIVGGSILAHEHFQGGHYEFAMERAEIEREVIFKGYENVKAGIVKWPMSVIRLRGNRDELVELADKILACWRGYTDKDAFIFAQTLGVSHNTITPIARMRNGEFELDLVLRNNITTQKHPLGVYHPHSELHHIKKENIGLIEVMGLAVLPARLKQEMSRLEEILPTGDFDKLTQDPLTQKHSLWAKEFSEKYDCITAENVQEIIQKEIGLVFAKVLEHAGVYKRDPQGQAYFDKFLDYVNK